MNLSGSDIVDLAELRMRAHELQHFRWYKMRKILAGEHRDLFPMEFRAGEVEKIAGFIRRSWRMFSRHVGKLPDIQVSSLSQKDKDKDRAERQENICFAYNDVWGQRFKMRILAQYLVGFGSVGSLVVPDPVSGYPMHLVEDPAHVLPGPGYASPDAHRGVGSWQAPNDTLNLNQQAGGSLDDVIVRKTLTGRQLRRWYPNSATLQALIPDTQAGWYSNHECLQFLDDTWWVTVLRSTGEVLSRAAHDTGWCPGQFITASDITSPMGSSDLEQQIGLEIAFMRILDQKLALNDSVVWPWMFTTGYVEVDPDERRIRAGAPDATAQFLTPPAQFQVNQDLLVLRDLLRVFNYETEATQGEVTGGPITGRGIVELNSLVVNTVQSFFDDLSGYMSRTYATAMVMDRNMFAGTVKSVQGQGRGEPFFLDYDPGKDIGDGFGRVTVEFGPGLGGFEGSLQMLQHLGADAISTETVMQKNPHIRSVTAERRRIVVEKAQKMLLEQSLTGELAVPPEWLAAFIDAVQGGAIPEQWIIANPPNQAAATPETVAPVPPEVAAQLAAQGAPVPGAPPIPEQGGSTIVPPPLQELIGAR